MSYDYLIITGNMCIGMLKMEVKIMTCHVKYEIAATLRDPILPFCQLKISCISFFMLKIILYESGIFCFACYVMKILFHYESILKYGNYFVSVHQICRIFMIEF